MTSTTRLLGGPTCVHLIQQRSQWFKETTPNCYMSQHVNFLTRVRGDDITSCIDRVITNTDNIINDVSSQPYYPQIDPLFINEQGVKKLLSGINSNKAPGPNQITCRPLKQLCEELTLVVTALFRQSHLKIYPPPVGRGPKGSTTHTHTSLQNYVFLNPQRVYNK